MILPSVNVALLEFVSGTLRLASGGPSNWFWYAWSSCPSIGRFQMIQKWVIPPLFGFRIIIELKVNSKVTFDHFPSKNCCLGMIPAYFPMKKKISFAQNKKMTPLSTPWVLIRFERFDSVYDLPVDPEPVQGTMTGIEPIRIRPLDCSMLRSIAVTNQNRLKPIRITTICNYDSGFIIRMVLWHTVKYNVTDYVLWRMWQSNFFRCKKKSEIFLRKFFVSQKIVEKQSIVYSQKYFQ